MEVAAHFSTLAMMSGLDDATINSLFWIRANYSRPVDLPDTTGLSWREGIPPVSGDLSADQHPDASQPTPQLAAPEARANRSDSPIESDQVREPAAMSATVDVPVEREGAEDSTTHCTAAEGEQCLDLGHLNVEQDLIDFSEDIYVELPACPEQSICLKLSTCLDFPPTLLLLSPPILPVASVPPPPPLSVRLHRHHGWRIPHLHLQPLNPALRLGPLTQQLPPRLSPPSSPPSPVGPAAPLGSLVPLALPWTPLLQLRLVTPSHRLRWAPPQSSVAPAPTRISGSPPPPRSPEPWAPPWPSGSSVSPRIIGSPSPPLSPPWLLPPSAPPWPTIVAAAW
ncbi:hypothetical protein M9458_039183, partial [Cirrhinus mrigala]